MSEIYGTFSTAYVEAMRLRLSVLEPENKDLRARVAELERDLEQAKADRARAAMDVRNPLLASLAALKCDNARLYELIRANRVLAYDQAKQAREDEAWALDAAVTIHPDGASKSFAPMFWSVRYWDGVRTMEVTAPTIHAALRALRAKVEGGAQ